MEVFDNIFLLSEKEGHEALSSAEVDDTYLKCCNKSPLNRIAREKHIYKPWPMSSAEFIQKAGAFRYIFTQLSHKAPILPRNRVNIIIMEPTADGGLPHTRSHNIICLPYSMLSSQNLIPTLFHELVHIFQRENPILVEAMYKNVWRCKRLSSKFIAGDLGERVNPDAMDLYYYSMTYDWFARNHFLREDSPQLNNVRTRFYNIYTVASTTIVPKELDTFFGRYADTSAIEHPHEIMAYMWTDIIFDKPIYKTPAQYGFEAWLDKIAKNK